MTNSIELFYTGGGITLAEVDLDANRYAVVSSEAPEYLTIYTHDDGEKTYLPEDMVVSTPAQGIAPDLKALYMKMLEKLKIA